jgi:predicted nucleic acid-binding protein
MFILDTELLFDLRRGEAGGAAPGLLSWAGSMSRQRLFISVISLLEVERGAAAAGRRGKELAQAWRSWIDEQLVPAFEGQVLAIDAAVARRQADLPLADARDGLLAATALTHGLTLATYHAARFRQLRLKTFDPRRYEPEMESDWREAARTGSHWLKNLFVRA